MDQVLSTTGEYRAPSGTEKLHILLLDPALSLPDRPGSTRSYDLAKRWSRTHHVTILTTGAALPAHAEALPAQNGMSIVASGGPKALRAGHLVPPAVTSAFTRGVAWRIWAVPEVDAVVAAEATPAIAYAMIFCIVRGIPLILEARRVAPLPPATATKVEKFAAWCGRVGFRIAAAFARKVVAGSGDIAATLLDRGVDPTKIEIAPVGSDAALFGAAGKIPADLTEIMARGPCVVYAGDLLPGIGLEHVIETAAAGLGTTFLLIGDGPARNSLAAVAFARGVLDKSVWFATALPRLSLAPILNAASAVLAPARHDSIEAAQPLHDAMAAGRPVIAMGDGAARELVESRGAGLALPRDPATAATELKEFLADGDGLRKASQQSAAMAAGRANLDRAAADARMLVEAAVAADPRAMVLRRRMLRTKRAIDIVASLAALIVALPVLAILMVAVCIKMGWPPLFTQERPGLKGKPFHIIKLRTMTNAKDPAGALLPDQQRLTPFGRFLRRSSLDELPELFNVLMGEMSLVGPRALLPEYMAHYTPEQRRRHDLRPGITGWAQVNGRNDLTWEERFAHDVWYVENVSLWLDLKIVMKTIWIVLTGKGVSAAGHATMPRFDEVAARREGAEDA